MEYIGEQRIENGFLFFNEPSVMTTVTNFLATKNSINFYSNKAFDLSSFGSFSFLKIPKFNFYST